VTLARWRRYTDGASLSPPEPAIPAQYTCRIGAFDVRTSLGFTIFGLIVASAAANAAAQDATPPDLPPPFTLSYVDGRGELARPDGVLAAQAPDVLDAGDRLLIADGRAELVAADGALVHVDRDADLRIDDDGTLRLVRGRLRIRTALEGTALDLVTPVGRVRLEPRGEYQITARDLDADVTIAAFAGSAAVSLPATDLPIAADDEVAIAPRGLEPRWSRAGRRADAFSDWSDRRVADMQQARGTQPLPVELTAYAPAFAAYGRWDTLPTYGPVWFPTAAPGWRPYANGHWRHTRYGWTWIDSDPWGWPVHHYGRWGRHASRGWYWIPQRTWGPAWVGWALEAGYVGWSPLGWNSQPLVDFGFGARVGPVGLWAGSWSVVPRSAFGGRGPIGRYFTDLRRLPGPVLGGFVMQNRAPRGPAGWERRLPPARGYGRPAPVRRGTRIDARPDGSREVAPRPEVRPRSAGQFPSPGRGATPPAPVRDAVRDPRRSRSMDARADDGRAGRTPEDDPASREVAPRPSGSQIVDRPAGRRGDARRVAPPADDSGRYGRPTPAGRGSGRPEAEAARPRAGGDGNRNGSAGGGPIRRGPSAGGGERDDQPRGNPPASGSGNRRRPR
jgi:hypothetical protein